MTDWQDALGDSLGSDVVRTRPVRGGDVSAAHEVHLADGRHVFAKTHASPPPGFFTTEAAGLAWLAGGVDEPGGTGIPEVLVASDDPPLLALGWIEEGRPGPTTEEALGRGLAALHAKRAETFGRLDRRTTGSRALPNEPCGTWAEFYATQRLLPLARLARDGGALPSASVAAIEDVAARLDDLGGPAEPPARLHGDLWAGNRIVDVHGRSWLIDPAAHGGHREFDLAMMRLFGGFGPEAFSAYEETTPLAPGWRQRVPLHQLAPLVVHAIKFGGGYVASVEDALDQLR